MAYRVIKDFTDGQDSKYIYRVGDKYPRDGAYPTAERIHGLLGEENKQGVPLIEEIREEMEPEAEEEDPMPRKHRRKKG